MNFEDRRGRRRSSRGELGAANAPWHIRIMRDHVISIASETPYKRSLLVLLLLSEKINSRASYSLASDA